MTGSIKKEKNIYSLWLMAPGMLIYAAFIVLPAIFTLYYSFTNWDFFSAPFLGLENYKDLLMQPNLNIAFVNSVLFTCVTSVLKIFFGLVLALFLNMRLKTRNFLRTAFFLPAVLNTIAVGIIFSAILHPEVGLLNILLRALHLDFLAQNWLTDIHLAIFSICAIDIWKWTGFTMVIFLAGLQSVSLEYYEAAYIDGASTWQKFKNITFPLIVPTLNNNLFLALAGGLSVFDIVMVTTNGGPGYATEVFNTVIYRAFGSNLQGEACAGNILLSLLVALVTLTAYTLIRKKEVEV